MKQRRWVAKDELRAIFQANPEQWFYINELIRLTGRYPNSVQKALMGLEKEGEIKTKKVDNKRFFQIKALNSSRKRENHLTTENIPWVKIVNRRTSFSFNWIAALAYIQLMPKYYGGSLPTLWYNSLTGGVYFSQEEFITLGRIIGSKLDHDLSFAQEDIQRCREVMNGTFKYCLDNLSRDLGNKSKLELKEYLSAFGNEYMRIFPYTTSPHAIERYFEQKIREEVPEEKDVSALLEPVYVRDPVVERGLEVASVCSRETDEAVIAKALEDYYQDYCWLSMFSVEDEPLNREYFEAEVAGLLKRVKDPEKELANLAKREEELKVQLETRLNQLGADKQLRQTVWFLQEYIRLRNERKNALCRAHYLVRPLLEAIAKKLEWTYEQICLLSFEEMQDLLSGDEAFWQKEVEKRQQGWALLMIDGKMKVITGAQAIVQTIEQYRIVQQAQDRGGVIKGRPASLGVAEGPVKVVRSIADLGKVAEGDVLVTRMTTPDFVPAMRRAAAIVTDEGGVTCHAAIVARELGVPCVIATGRATQVLADGVVVRVDGQAGEVRVVGTTAGQSHGPWVGTTVYPGKVTGKAKIVSGVGDFGKVNEGEVVVCAQATPEYFSLLYRAGGLIIDEDSLTGHGVVYAGALKLPCVMGTGNAREGLRDGQVVTLDATNGVVRRG